MKKGMFLIIILIIVISSMVLLLNSKTSFKEYSCDYYYVKYDNTWKVKETGDEFKLIHKKSKAEFVIKYKLLDDNYIDISLDELIGNVIYSIEQQNSEYNLLNEEKINGDYEGYSYLFENDENNVLVNVYKKDNKLIIVSYEANMKYYDIVLDSVDSILDSLKIKGGE